MLEIVAQLIPNANTCEKMDNVHLPNAFQNFCNTLLIGFKLILPVPKVPSSLNTSSSVGIVTR